MLVDAAGSWETKASCAGGALEVLFGAIGVRTDSSPLSQVSEVMLVASCVLRLSTFVLQLLSTFQAYFTIVLLRDRGLADAAGSLRVGACVDVALEVVSMAIGTRKGSVCDLYGRAQARGEEDLPEGKYWISACDVYGGVSAPPHSLSTVEICRPLDRCQEVAPK